MFTTWKRCWKIGLMSNRLADGHAVPRTPASHSVKRHEHNHRLFACKNDAKRCRLDTSDLLQVTNTTNIQDLKGHESCNSDNKR